MSKNQLPPEIKAEALRAIEKFNQKEMAGTGARCLGRFKGKFLYLDRETPDGAEPLCRLDYKPGKKQWEFAIYKHSSSRYDPDDWFFPGSQYVDGTVKGALKAATEAYP